MNQNIYMILTIIVNGVFALWLQVDNCDDCVVSYVI